MPANYTNKREKKSDHSPTLNDLTPPLTQAVLTIYHPETDLPPRHRSGATPPIQEGSFFLPANYANKPEKVALAFGGLSLLEFFLLGLH